MALVDAEYWFIWDLVGAPGTTHDSALLQSTDLWKRLIEEEMISNVVQKLESVKIPLLILVDGDFPLELFWMKPHRDAILLTDKRYLIIDIAQQD